MRSITSIVAVLLVAATAFAQGDQGGQYEIHGEYNATLLNAEKIDLRPQAIDTILPEIPVRYDLLPAKAETPVRVDSITAAKLTVLAPQQKLYKGYAKAGFGLYTTPLGELYYDQARSKDNGYGFHVKHMSSNGGLDDVGPSDYSNNSIHGYYKHFLPNHELGGRLIYDRKRVSYYGYPSNDSIEDVISSAVAPPKDARKQFYNDIGFQGRIRSLFADSTKIAHDVGIEVHSYSNNTGSRETNMRVRADLGMQDGKEIYGGTLLIDNNAYRGKLDGNLGDFTQNGVLIGLMPHVSLREKDYLVKVGAGMYYDAQGGGTFHFFPQAYGSYSLFDGILVPYAGIDGERKRNSFRSLTMENPFLTGAPSLQNTSKLYDFYGGMRGSFSNDLGFDLRVSKSRMKDMPLFVSMARAPFGDRMAAIYDQVDILDLSGELTYNKPGAVRLNARVDVYTYSVRRTTEPWNLPPYKLTFGANYDLRQKLIVKADVIFLGARKALRYVDGGMPGTETFAPVTAPTTHNLDGYMDLYLGLEYRYTKRLSLFIDASNLSASKYERWYRYPVQRSLIIGGATFSF
ncbi:MAG TPA: hypothetical protein PK760_02240 [Flavobacteriales bacterium]|nr:hypothetical protein [Flavobacteriales bacterium]